MVYRTKYTADVLAPIVASSYSWAEILRKLNLKPTGGSFRLIKHRVIQNNICIDHLLGKRWAKGKTKETNSSVNKMASKLRRPNKDVFVRNSPETCGWRIRNRLIKMGVLYQCTKCGLLPLWCGNSLVLHLDHINGVTNDNRKSNLRFLCQNCHQQTETWGNKKSRNTPE